LFRVGSLGQRGEQALGDWPGFANYMVSGRSYIAGPPGTSVTSTNTVPISNNTIVAVVAYIQRPCTITSLSVRTSSSNASAGALVRMGLYECTTDGIPGNKISQNSAGSSVGDSATSTTITQSLDNPVIITEPCKIFIVSQHAAVTTGARYSINSSISPFVTYEGATSPSNALTSVAICGFTASSLYSNGLPASFGTATVSTSLTECLAAAYTLA